MFTSRLRGGFGRGEASVSRPVSLLRGDTGTRSRSAPSPAADTGSCPNRVPSGTRSSGAVGIAGSSTLHSFVRASVPTFTSRPPSSSRSRISRSLSPLPETPGAVSTPFQEVPPLAATNVRISSAIVFSSRSASSISKPSPSVQRRCIDVPWCELDQRAFCTYKRVRPCPCPWTWNSVSPEPSQAPETLPPLFSWWTSTKVTCRPARRRTSATSTMKSLTSRSVPALRRGLPVQAARGSPPVPPSTRRWLRGWLEREVERHRRLVVTSGDDPETTPRPHQHGI
jgi:hypothetical protein